MNSIRSILVIVDPTAEHHPCVAKGALLAQRLGARLELYACETKSARERRWVALATEEQGAISSPSVSKLLDGLAGPLKLQGLDVATSTECASPLQRVLSEKVFRVDADLVIKDTHHHSLAKRTILTNTDWHLIRTCPVPLLLTKSNPWEAQPCVLAAIDPSHANDKPATLDYRILHYASLFTRKLGGELHVLHGFWPAQELVAGTGTKGPVIATISPSELAAEESRLRPRLLELVQGFPVAVKNVHLEAGSSLDVLPRIAGQCGANILVMGAISRSGLKRAFIGSTAEDVLESLACDALIVKPPDFATDLPF